jgi:hypothetical protein
MKRYIGLVLLLISQFAHSQIKNYAEIRNEEGAVISGATIHVLNTDIYLLSNSAGQFTIPDLPKGIYPVEISSIGYARVEKQIKIPHIGDMLVLKLNRSTMQLMPSWLKNRSKYSKRSDKYHSTLFAR